MISRFLLATFACWLAAVVTAAPQHTILLKEAAAAAKAGDNAAALTKVEEAAKLRPDYPRIQLNLARLNAAMGKADDALAALERLADMGLDLNVAADPALAPLAELPRFRAVVTRLSAAASTAHGELAPFRLKGVTGIIESGVFDPGTEDWYFGDVRNRCIWKRGVDGALRKVTSDDEKLDGVFKLLLTPDRRTLWAGTASVGAMANAGPDEEGARSALIAFDFASGRIAARYPAPADGRKHLLGDFILAADGALYATDSFAPVIWRLPPGGAQLEPWLENADFLNLQGLAFSADGQSLFVADYSNGIWRIDVATKAAALLAAPANATFFGVDGLYAIPGGLLAIQNGVNPQRVLRIDPATGATAIVAGGYPAMTDLSLGTVAGGRFHFIADGGWALFDPPPEKAPKPRELTVYSFKIE
jgi:hypothetical protein